MQMRC